jgi:hypothetical protein
MPIMPWHRAPRFRGPPRRQKKANTYSGDLKSDEFADEMVQFVEFAKSRGCHTPSSLATLLHSEDLQTSFPNVEIAVRMYMSIMVQTVQAKDRSAKWH